MNIEEVLLVQFAHIFVVQTPESVLDNVFIFEPVYQRWFILSLDQSNTVLMFGCF